MANQFGSLRESRVKQVSVTFAAPYILKYEYMGKMPGWTSHAFGHFFDDVCGGVLLFGSPICRLTKQFPEKKIIQLHRGVSLPKTPPNSASFFLSKALLWLRKNTDFDMVLAFSNPLDGEIGTVYQASNWSYIGWSSNSDSYVLDGDRIHPRTLRARHGTTVPEKLRAIYGNRLVIAVGAGRKHRYVYPLKDVMIPSQPYPKREQEKGEAS